MERFLGSFGFLFLLLDSLLRRLYRWNFGIGRWYVGRRLRERFCGRRLGLGGLLSLQDGVGRNLCRRCCGGRLGFGLLFRWRFGLWRIFRTGRSSPFKRFQSPLTLRLSFFFAENQRKLVAPHGLKKVRSNGNQTQGQENQWQETFREEIYGHAVRERKRLVAPRQQKTDTSATPSSGSNLHP